MNNLEEAIEAIRPDTLSLDQVRKLLLGLARDEVLWSAPLLQSLDRLLVVSLAGCGGDTAAVWQISRSGERMDCVARRERITGRSANPASSGVLSAARFPAYFAAMNAERVLDASDANNDPRTSDLLDGFLIPKNVNSLIDATVRRAGAVCGCCAVSGSRWRAAGARRKLTWKSDWRIWLAN